MMRMPRETAYYDFCRSADFLEELFGGHIEHLLKGMQKRIEERQPGYSHSSNQYQPCLVKAIRQ